jgi:cellulose synthase (UDP-forming)
VTVDQRHKGRLKGRRFVLRNVAIQVSGVLLIASGLWYTPWLLAHLNHNALWMALPFGVATCLLLANLTITVINNWQRAVPLELEVARGREPTVAVILATAHEPSDLVDRTARSILRQDWPHHRLRLIVSDDAHAREIAEMVESLKAEHRQATIVYHQPPPRGAPERAGEAKAGNLNSALAYVRRHWNAVAFVETRDADDEVADGSFLRQCVAQLEADPGAAFVQTIKEARVAKGDPFDNLQAHFFRGVMYARYAANAVFPCGSGLLWRRAALDDIGGFPTWNVVEDLQSGVEALRRGWRGIYLPIVGALAQHAPEDIPNAYKQRGTWALDNMRLLVWGDLKGLNLRQRLHFWEPGLFYLQGFVWIPFIASPVAAFVFGSYPVSADLATYALHFWPYGLALELFLASLSSRYPYTSVWRARQIWVGFAPVYAKACLVALLGGRHRKPVYKVTRKHDAFGWYWRETLVQTIVLCLLLSALAYGVATANLESFDVGSAYWALFFAIMLGGFVTKSWFGVGLRAELAKRARSPWLGRSPVPSQQAAAPASRRGTPNGLRAARRGKRAPVLAMFSTGSATLGGIAFLTMGLLSSGRYDYAAVLPAALGVLVTAAAVLPRRRAAQRMVGIAGGFASAGLFGTAALVL